MRQSDLATLLVEHAGRHGVPGAEVGVLHQGTRTTACCGVADTDTGRPVTLSTRFGAGSLTKSMAATVVVTMAAAAKLSLDDPVAARVPELAASQWAESATLRDLMANRSGLPLRAGWEFDFDGGPEQDDAALARLVAAAADDPPAGTFWSYSNLGWCVLGRAVETATGLAWEEAMRRWLFTPVGMEQSGFGGDRAAGPRVSGHEVTAEGPLPVPPLMSRAHAPAGTTALTTVGDLLTFADLHLLDPSLAVMRTTHADVSILGWLDAWCLGWARFDWGNGLTAFGWDGIVNGERQAIRLLPDRGTAVVLLTNSSTGRAMYRTLMPELFGVLLGIDLVTPSLDPLPAVAVDLGRFAGHYGWPDQRVEVQAGTGCLRIGNSAGTFEALPIDERTFLLDPPDPDNPTLSFGGSDESGRPTVLYEMIWGLPRLSS